jgi:hypothetical protein
MDTLQARSTGQRATAVVLGHERYTREIMAQRSHFKLVLVKLDKAHEELRLFLTGK